MCARRREPVHGACGSRPACPGRGRGGPPGIGVAGRGDPTGWFDRLYTAGARGQVLVKLQVGRVGLEPTAGGL
jgi:hypothetical protein